MRIYSPHPLIRYPFDGGFPVVSAISKTPWPQTCCAEIDCTRLQHIVAAHLSERNNRPELAIGALAGAMGCAESWIAVACQAEGFAWRQLA